MSKTNITLILACFVLATQLQGAPEKTIANLNTAFRGESNASHRYQAFAQKADTEGHRQIAKLFRAASKAEAIHRDAHKDTITKLGGKPDVFTLDDPKVGTTRENLQAAIKGESYERDVMYPDFLKEAQTASLPAAIRTIRYALAAETEHAKLYQDALDNLGKNKETSLFVCPVCGYTTTGLPGANCPVCSTGKDRFIVFS
jgi:rubrerythrin